MKKALYYSFRGAWAGGLGYALVAVTMEKPSHWHGRTESSGVSCWGQKSDLRGKFATRDEALAAQKGLEDIQRKYQPLLDTNTRERQQIYNNKATEERLFLDKMKSGG